MNAAQHNSMAAMNAATDAPAPASPSPSPSPPASPSPSPSPSSPASPSPSPSSPASPSPPPALECRGVSKVFAHDAIRVTALQDIDLRVAAGERI
ncbi:MAG: hypothetical protein OXU88_03985, partial [Gammaproteobacteria bacterium]|nr:hypothetical protein [Gammaproteobacteria bacterium]